MIAATAPDSASPTGSRLGPYLKEAKYELLKTVRLPAFAIPAIAFPVVFYVLFGLTMRPEGAGNQVATYLLATYGAFGVIGAALFAFGVGVATERGQGWLLLKRATPMPPTAYLVAKALTAAAFSAVIVGLLAALAAFVGGVELAPGGWLALFAILVVGTLPFSAIGLAFGLLCGPNSAPPIVNLVYLPASFASGLWMPLSMLPDFFRGLALWLPPYHLGQLALKVVKLDDGHAAWLHVVALAVATVLAAVVTAWAYRRGSDRTYG